MTAPLPPPTADPLNLPISSEQIRCLDIGPLKPWQAMAPQDLPGWSGRLELTFDWPRDAADPRELSEIPEVRLWSLRADALLPWLPLLLERRGGGLTRHVAMLLPHGFHPSDGIRFAPDGLELWITHRLFLLDGWAMAADLDCRRNLTQMAEALGFDLDHGFWDPLRR